KIKNAQKELEMDVLGSILVFAATVCVVLLVTWGGADYAWDSWEILVLIFASVALFALFGLQEMRHSEPIINLRLFKIRNFAVTCLIMIFFGISMFGGFSFLPIFFQDICGDSAIISGLKLVPMVIGMSEKAGTEKRILFLFCLLTIGHYVHLFFFCPCLFLFLGMMFASMGTGLYVSKTGNFIWFPKFGMAFVAIGEGLLALLTKHMSFGVEWIFLFIMGIGMGMGFPVFNGIVQNSVPEKDMASSVAGVTFIRSIGGSVGVAIFGSVLNQQVKKNYTRYHGDGIRAETEALHLVFLCSMAPAILAFLLTFLIKNTDIFVRKGQAAAPAME
ncbi:exporter, partial [Reticulomyxa filosa]